MCLTTVQPLPGPLHRGAGDGRRAVPHQDPLLLPGPDARSAAAGRRAQLPHLLPDAGWPHARRTLAAAPRRLHRQRLAVHYFYLYLSHLSQDDSIRRIR